MPAISVKLDQLLADGDMEGVQETMLREGVRMPEPILAALKTGPGWPAMVKRACHTPREMAALVGWRFEPECFRVLTLPVCLLVGGDTPPEHHHRGFIERLAAVLPNFRVVEIPGQEHSAPRTAPEAVAQRVLSFLNTSNA